MKQLKINISTIVILILFFLYSFLNFYGLHLKELQGDEASSILAVLPMMKFLKNPQLLASVFLFGHGPIRGLVEIPFLYFFGMKEFWLYLPNVLASLGIFIFLYKLLKKNFKQDVVLISLSLLAVNGSIVLQRLVMGVGWFLFFSTLMIFYFSRFLKSKVIKDFNYSLIYLFLTIFTYVEGFIFLPSILFWLWQKKLLNSKTQRSLSFFFISIFIIFCLWLFFPWLALRLGHINDLSNAGLFRVIMRAGGGLRLNFIYQFNLFKQYNSLLFVLILFLGLLLSFFHKKFLFFWSFLFFPLLYFCFIKGPTVHLFNYLNLIVVLSGLGWSTFFTFFKNKVKTGIKLVFYGLLFLAIVFNIQAIKEKYFIVDQLSPLVGWGKLTHRGLKATAYQLREKSHICDKIYTDIEGHVARLYFGRAYVKDPSQADWIILSQDLKQDKETERLFNRKYASFDQLLPYFDCKN